MKLERLTLVRFGHFRNLELDLASEGPALHLLFGENEAGKSTTLRAILGLLYGIPERSADTHAFGGDLRLSAVISNAAGDRLQLTRRKGRKNTLLDIAGEPLPEAAVGRYLGGVDADLFASMYGLDHDRLRRGAEALLSDRGAVGETLFEAGIGGRGVQRVLSELKQESEELFLPRGRKRKLNEAIASFRDASKRANEASLRADVYEAQQRALDVGQRERAELREQRRLLAEERGRLQRLLTVASPLAQRSELLRQLSELSVVVILPDAARETRLAASKMLADCTPEIRQRRALLGRLQARLAVLQVPETLLSLAEDTIKAVRDQLGSRRKAVADLPRRRQQLETLRSEARAVLRRLGWSRALSEVERHRIARPEVVRIRELSRTSAALRQAAEQSRLEQVALEAESAALAEVPAPAARQLGGLREALDAIHQLGDFRRQRGQLQQAIDQRREALRDATAVLRPRVPEDLLVAPLPLLEVVESHAAEFRDLRQATAERSKASRVCEEERLRAEGARAGLVGEGGEPPSEGELRGLREARDQALQALLAARGQRTLAPGSKSLTNAIAAADLMADRLRWEAGRVTRLAHIDAERATLATQAEAFAADQRADDATRQDLERRWDALWRACGVPSGPPAEMLAWLRAVGALRQQTRELQQLVAQLGAHDGELARLCDQLAAAMAISGASTEKPDPPDPAERTAELRAVAEVLLEEHRRAVERHTRAQGRREELERRRLTAAQVAGARAQELVSWRAEWGEAMAHLSLSPTATVEQAEVVLDELDGLFMKIEEIEQLKGRIDGMERDNKEFEKEVRGLTDRHLFQLGDVGPEDAAEELIAGHAQAHRDAEERDRIQRETAEHEHRLAQLMLQQERATEALSVLCQRARVEGVEALEDAERASERRVALERALAELEASLLRVGDGRPLAALEAEAAALSPESARARLEEVEVQADTADQELETVTHRIATAEEVLGGLIGRQGAAAAWSEAATHAATVGVHVQRLIRVRLAERLLRREVQRYRKAHQAPILGAAEQLFVRLTLGRYSGLQVDYDRGDEPVLCAVRDSGALVGVEGLSDGTRDQLYLALRLATLQHQAVSSELLPLVLDDVLIHFDDERARAALAVIGEFAEATQVLFFTHHARLIELARDSVPAGVLHEHRLESRSAPVQEALL